MFISVNTFFDPIRKVKYNTATLSFVVTRGTEMTASHVIDG